MNANRRHLLALRVVLAAALAAVVFVPATALAQGGIRAGVSADPDQFFVGGHLDLGTVANRITFRPNVEIGFGDHLTTVTVNPEFAYWLPARRSAWKMYVGAGPSLVVLRHDGGPFGDSRSDVEPGFNLLFGVEHARGLIAEVKVGLIDSPAVKFTVGYAFK